MLEENSLDRQIIASAQSQEKYLIKENVLIKKLHSERDAIVKYPFYVQLSPSIDGYVATSDIANIYEMESTKGDAIRSYLYSLVDELMWLREHKDELSQSVLEELRQIEMYVNI